MIEMPIHYWILGMNQLQAKDFARENEISQRDYTFMHTPTQFRGIKDATVIILDGWEYNISPYMWDKFKEEIHIAKRRNNIIEMNEHDKITKELIWRSQNGLSRD